MCERSDHVVLSGEKLLSGCIVDYPDSFSYTMGFGDLKTDAGLRALNDYLADRSYIEG